jgi:hypothetical protein
MNEERKLTFGEKAVGLSFNPSGMSDVDKLKKAYAEIIDHMNDFREGYINRADREMIRLCSIAIAEAQTAQMWAVKAVTWRG